MDHYQTLISLYIRLDEQLRTELRGVTLQALRGSFTLQRKAATLAQIEAKLREMQVALSVADNEALTAWWADQQAVTRGQLAHLGNLHGVALGADNPATWAGVNHRAINAIAADLSGRRAAFLGLVQHADGRPGGILRQVDDYLRTIAGEELPASLVGESTYRVGMLVRERGIKALADGQDLQTLAQGLDRCLGVTYANGTQHSLHAYGQMVARTGVMRARSEAAMGEMQSYGVHAYQVSTHGTICYLCKAHEGVVYALDAIGEQQGYPRAPMPPPYHPACGHIALPWFGVPSEGPPKAPPDIVYASDREKYAWMRENHPELLQASRQGFGSEAEWKRAKRVLHEGKGVELSELRGKRWRYRGIEQRRIQATADMLTNHKQPYKQAMRGVTDAYMQTPDYAKQRAKTGFYSPTRQRNILAGKDDGDITRAHNASTERVARVSSSVRDILQTGRAVTEAEVRDITKVITRAPFNAREVTVPGKLRGITYQGVELKKKTPSLDVHLVKRVVAEKQWAEGTTAEQYLTDLRTIVSSPTARIGVYERHGKTYVLAFDETEKIIPRARLGTNSAQYSAVFYEAESGIIKSGYQFSALETLNTGEITWIK